MYIENVDHTASHMQAYLSVFSYFLFNEDLNTILNSALCVGCLRAGSPLGTTGNTHHMNVQLIHTHTHTYEFGEGARQQMSDTFTRVYAFIKPLRVILVCLLR